MIEALIEELTRMHTNVLEAFSQVRDLGLGTSASNAALAHARRTLSHCLEREERELFPLLQANAVMPDHGRRLQISRAELEQLRRHAEQFFGRYAQGGEGLTYALEFGRLVGLLQSRVRSDETYLYAPFKRMGLQSRA